MTGDAADVAAWRRMALRLAATAALVGLYYRIDWGWLAHATARAVAVALRLLGHSVALVADDGGPALIVAPPERGLQAFLVTANCTYADLVLAAAPFCWATGLGLRRNVARLGLLTAAVAALNLARLTWAVSAFAQGVAWRWAHQAPDLIAHGGVLALVLFDLARRSPPPAAATVG